jgi:hypothetical protein
MAHSTARAPNILLPRQARFATAAVPTFSINTEMINDSWGLPPGLKLDDTLRVGFQNFGGFPEFASHFKNASFRQFILQHDFDIFGLAETNLKWCILPAASQFYERIRNTWPKTHTSLAYNRTVPSRDSRKLKGQSEFRQYGGVALLSTTQAAHRVSGSGRDPTGLGRWTWTSYKGRSSVSLKVVAAYRPCLSDGALSTFSQHVNYFHDQDDDRCPRQAFLDDLKKDVSQWIKDGEQVVVMLDANGDVRDGAINQTFDDLGMREVLLEFNSELPATATFSRNHQETPIDGIFATPSVQLQGGGYFAFGEGPGSDHRCLWFDISYQTAFGHSPPPMGTFKARRLTCTDPRIRQRYNDLYRPYVQQHRLDMRSYTLQSSVYGPLSQVQATEFENISSLRAQGMAYATHNCRKLNMGEVDFNPEINTLRKNILAWNLQVRKLQGCRVGSRYLQRTISAADLPQGSTALLLPAALVAQKDNFKAYQEAKKGHVESRVSWLQHLARAKSLDDGKAAEKHVTSMLAIEKQRRQARNVKRMNHKLKSFGTSRIVAPDADGTWVEFTSQDDIEAGCKWENSRRFSQTSPTPYMTWPLVEDFGYLAQGPATQAVLAGTYVPPPGTDIYARKLFPHLAMDPSVAAAPPMKIVFSIEDHIKGWRKAREFTATGPSGLTFSHFIAATYDPLLASFDATMANIPYATGYSPIRWQSGTDVMIPKSTISLRVDKLRTLLLLDPEFNQNNKILGRSLMRQAEAHSQIPPEQYGSRKKHRAIEAALNKVLTQDIWRQKRQSGALCSNDAKSCYDRVVHSFAILCMLRLGCPLGPILSMFITLQKMQHFIGTAFGVSSTSFTGGDVPFQGLGQGNGAAPTGWAVVSAPIINMVRAAGFGATFISALTSAVTTFVCYAFVDDTDLVHTRPGDSHSGSDLIPEMQDAVDHWEGGLRASGGALVPSKSHWYLVDWKWMNGSWRSCTIADNPGDISMLDHNGVRAPLDRVEVTEARKSLGLMIAGDCNWKAEHARLLRASRLWKANLQAGHLSESDAWYALNHTINRTVEYPMMATYLDKSQCEDIMKPFLNAGLSASGVTSKMPRPVVWGPLRYQGLGIRHLWTTQGVEHLLAILRHGTQPSLTGRLLRTTLEDMQLETGLSKSFLSYSYDDFGVLATRSWIKATWEFLSASRITVIDPFEKPSLACANDCFLMEKFFEHGYRGSALELLNSCRKHIHALRLSDICSADGSFISDSAIEVQLDLHRTSPIHWPPTHRPELSVRSHWRAALSKIFVRPTTPQTLIQPLLPFTAAASDSWLWKYSSSEQRLFVPNGASWDFYHVSAGRRRSLNRLYQLGRSVHFLPPDSTAATVSLQGSQVRLISRGLPSPAPTRAPAPLLFSQTLDALPAASKWAIQEYALPSDLSPILASLRAGSARAISDGSFKDKFGTSAFTILDAHDCCILGLNIVPGHPDDQGAYRSELAGLFGIVLVVNLLCSWAGITSGGIEIGCDGLSALNKAFETWPLEPADPHFDMLSALRKMIASSPISWTTRHVAGHQDNDITAKLDFWAEQNIRMDNLAKIFWMTHSHTAPMFYPISDEGFQVWLGDRKLSSHSSDVFFDHIHGKTLLRWHATHHRFPACYARRIDWDVCEAALKRLPMGRRRWVAKHTSGHCAVGTMLVHRKEQPTPDCPRCGDSENARHVWRCQDPSVFFVWALLMSSFSSWLESVRTAPEIIFWIIRRLTEWRSSEPLSIARTDLPGLIEAIEAQDRIGWLAFFEGCIAKEWAGVQEAHFIWLGRRNTGKRWATSLVVKLWEIAWDIWDHRNQIKYNLESAQDIARRDDIIRNVRSEYAFGRSGLPRRDWRLFKRPLRSLLGSSSHYLDAWLLRVTTARARQVRRQAEVTNPRTNVAEDDLPNLNSSRRLFQQFLNPDSNPSPQ